MTARPMPSLLRAMPGPLVPVMPSEPPNAGADGRADGRDLVLGLEGLDAEALEGCQLVQDVAGGRDRVAAVEQRPAGELAGGEEAEGRGLVAGDVAVEAGRQLGLRHVVVLREGFRGLAVVVAGLERRDVGLGDLGVAVAEALFDVLDRSCPAAGCTSRTSGRGRTCSWSGRSPGRRGRCPCRARAFSVPTGTSKTR